jgi:hypothetical protein
MLDNVKNNEKCDYSLLKTNFDARLENLDCSLTSYSRKNENK